MACVDLARYCSRCRREHRPDEPHRLRVAAADWLWWKRRRIARAFRRVFRRH